MTRVSGVPHSECGGGHVRVAAAPVVLFDGCAACARVCFAHGRRAGREAGVAQRHCQPARPAEIQRCLVYGSNLG